MLNIKASNERCLCDFTFDFYWQHKGERLDPQKTICDVSFADLVKALIKGETVKIEGDAGSRLGSSLGVSLIRMGGNGGPIDGCGNVIVDGDVGSRMGISMLRGAIYISGKANEPLGNVIEVPSDLTGYRKFISVTEALEKGIVPSLPNTFSKNTLTICDGILRDTLCARNSIERVLAVKHDAGMSTGILMQNGRVEVDGNTDKNTGVLMRGGRLVVRGDTRDFTATKMRGGEILIEGDAGSFACAHMSGGSVYAKSARPVPPAASRPLNSVEIANISKVFGLNALYAMIYRKFSIQ